MTATPIEGPAPVIWFLTARESGSSVRITPGMTLREDGAGRLKLGTAADDQGWVRFDIEDNAPWVSVISPRFALASGARRLGDRLRLDESLELVLPNNVFHFNRSLNETRRSRRSEVRVVSVDADDGPPPIRLLSTAVEVVPATPAEPPAPRPAELAEAAPLRVRSPRTRSPRARPRRRRRTTEAAGVVLLLLVTMDLASPARDSGPGFDRPSPGDATSGMASAATTPLIESVEVMLAGSGAESPSATALQFAIEAYRLAIHQRPGDPTLHHRLEELQSQLHATGR